MLFRKISIITFIAFEMIPKKVKNVEQYVKIHSVTFISIQNHLDGSDELTIEINVNNMDTMNLKLREKWRMFSYYHIYILVRHRPLSSTLAAK